MNFVYILPISVQPVTKDTETGSAKCCAELVDVMQTESEADGWPLRLLVGVFMDCIIHQAPIKYLRYIPV